LKQGAKELMQVYMDQDKVRLTRPDEEKIARHLVLACSLAVQFNPEDVGAQGDLADAHYALGVVYRDRNQKDKLKAAWLEADKVADALARAHRDDWQVVANAGRIYYNLGVAAAERGDQEEVIEWQSKALDRMEPLLEMPAATKVRWFVCWAHVGRGTARLKLSQPREALPDWERALELADEEDREPIRLHGLAYTLARLGEPRKAAAAAEQALPALPRTGEDFLVAAQVFALNAGAEETQQSERSAARAVEYLKEARQRGAFRAPEAREKLTKGGDFKALRARDDFRAFLHELGSD
jgi:tetratricopeptide (TPR) repeat protein